MNDCNKMHTLMEESNDKKSTFTKENNFEQNCINATENRAIGEREQRIEKFAEGFCGCGER